jgi:hypothetical protein
LIITNKQRIKNITGQMLITANNNYNYSYIVHKALKHDPPPVLSLNLELTMVVFVVRPVRDRVVQQDG